ncbi:hypothetical protein HNQ07_004549 [Deinococcus metalli]|uniref:Uncharacterized protein n=1 Tax=Deinococcus metalli TaxID=1141878 RepID=A0A7W8NQG9_9DEIO|nr:hypothetical protein [Deinococcus metalli]MBB5379039.1 hypothetical protein [Deinococcus metalli]GHF63805.1 hypothetical protein GCM10017781_44660 [Deinococcus metalli]
MNPASIQRSAERYRHPSADRIRLYGALLLMLVLTAVLGRARPGDLGTRGALKRSAFTRIMFMDIGALSTLGALYLVLNGRTAVRVPAAIASLFVGSFALLPALAYEDWAALRRQHEEAGGAA